MSIRLRERAQTDISVTERGGERASTHSLVEWMFPWFESSKVLSGTCECVGCCEAFMKGPRVSVAEAR